MKQLPQCDCCLQRMDRMWAYQHRAFCIELLEQQQQYKAGWWFFCIYCHALFQDWAYGELAARVITILGVPADFAHAAFERLYRTLSRVTYGEAVEWNEGQDWSENRFACPEINYEI